MKKISLIFFYLSFIPCIIFANNSETLFNDLPGEGTLLDIRGVYDSKVNINIPIGKTYEVTVSSVAMPLNISSLARSAAIARLDCTSGYLMIAVDLDVATLLYKPTMTIKYIGGIEVTMESDKSKMYVAYFEVVTRHR
jgi:hypothetical protein